jgi:ribosomal protein S2
MNSLHYRTTESKVSYELMGCLLKNSVLFGIRSKNKNLFSSYHESRLRYNYLSADLYYKQMEELAEYMRYYYEKGKESSLIVVDRTNSYTRQLRSFCLISGLKYVPGKLKAGILTNIQESKFEPAGVFVLHDKKETQIISQCLRTRTPVIGFNNLVKECNLYTRVVIMNNFHQNSIYYSLWYLLTLLAGLKLIEDVPSFEDFVALSTLVE